jgi:hypothetical protein
MLFRDGSLEKTYMHRDGPDSKYILTHNNEVRNWVKKKVDTVDSE